MTERERFDNILRETGRLGIENVLFELDKLGFYSAPASTKFHGSYPDGLLKHSLNVYDEAKRSSGVQWPSWSRTTIRRATPSPAGQTASSPSGSPPLPR